MPFNPSEIAVAIAVALGPFTPFLMEVGKTGGKKLVEVIAEKGGEAAWNLAQTIWRRISAVFNNDPEVQSAATMVAAAPNDASRLKILAEVLSTRFTDNPDLAKELLLLLGGQGALQQVIADRSSWVEDVTQKMRGEGSQTVQADEKSTVRNIRQQID